MAEIIRKIVVPRDEADRIDHLLATEPEDEDSCFDEDESIVYTADFGSGIQMDVKLCGVQFEEGGVNTPWTEAVLFVDGCEICCSEPGDEFFGKWEHWLGSTKYIAEVVREGENT